MPGYLRAVVLDSPALQPIYPEGKPTHVTLQYGVERDDWESLVGLPMTVAAIAHCHNDRIQAIAVVLPSWCQCINPHPHVTVSWVHGAYPVEANGMLAGVHNRVEVAYPVATLIEWVEWGEKQSGDRVCRVCREKKLRSDNKTGICWQCQPRLQKDSKRRGNSNGLS